MKYLIIATLFLFVGCDSAEVQGPVGGLKGKVGLYDIHGKILADASGVLVNVEGTSFSTISDSNGNWTIKGLPATFQSLSFSKVGYGTKKELPFLVPRDSITGYPLTIYLHQPLPYTVVLDSITPPEMSPRKLGWLSGRFVGASLEDRPRIMARVIFGTSPTMNIDDTTTYLGCLFFRSIFFKVKDSVLTFEESGFGWENYGPTQFQEAKWLEAGMKVYLQAYPWYEGYDLGFIDPVTLKRVTSLPYTVSPVYSVTVP